MPYAPGALSIGYGPGLTRADINLFAGPGGEICDGTFLKFSTGETTLPDDAAIARLERTATVPCQIFDVLREALGGRTEPPLMLDAAHLESGNGSRAA